MLLEERNDRLGQVIQASHAIRHPVAVVRTDHAAPEEVLECVQELQVAPMLDYREFREYLESGSHLRMPVDADEEASFAVDETDHPLCLELHHAEPNVKSLRVLPGRESSLRIVPMSCGLFTALRSRSKGSEGEYPRAVRGVSRIWFGFTKASEFLTLGPL